MRALSLGSLVVVIAACSVRVPRPPAVQVQVNDRGRRTKAKVPGEVEARGRIEVGAGARVEAEAELELEAELDAPVPLEEAPVVEFFGVPLEGAQDVVFVLDRSGSMSELAQGRLAEMLVGDQATGSEAPRKIDVARAELVAALEGLPAGTRLNVIFFDDGLEAFAATTVALEESGREELVGFVRDAAPYGRTALAPAMRTAFLMNARRIVLLSDGLGNVGGGSDVVLRDAREAMRGGVRIDTIGLGGDQDAALLDALARESGGIYQAL